MGDAADDAFDSALRQYENYDPNEYDPDFDHVKNPKTFQSRAIIGKWRVANGDIINIRDMSESHIRHAITFCIRFNNRTKLRELRDEIDNRNSQNQPDGYEDFLRRVGDIE